MMMMMMMTMMMMLMMINISQAHTAAFAEADFYIGDEAYARKDLRLSSQGGLTIMSTSYIPKLNLKHN